MDKYIRLNSQKILLFFLASSHGKASTATVNLEGCLRTFDEGNVLLIMTDRKIKRHRAGDTPLLETLIHHAIHRFVITITFPFRKLTDEDSFCPS